jgi:hypothetical protein
MFLFNVTITALVWVLELDRIGFAVDAEKIQAFWLITVALNHSFIEDISFSFYLLY